MFDKHSFNLSHLEPCSHIYGPGARFIVWLQGCTLACKGCWNKEMWSHQKKSLKNREVLLKKIIKTPNISGVTILGGEPFQQAENTLWLLEKLKKVGNLTSIIYSGYTQRELIERGFWSTIDNNADLIITGRYQQDKRDTSLYLRGSTNQKLIYTSNTQLKREDEQGDIIEIIIDEFAKSTILGYPDP
ncbi:4Fe-4S single cluster domain-containing protein [Pseudoalteromonas aurantia]|uniref:Anaerobic ribonucleoside-triphosphate reductase-activating protein n=1 Tax=Pseudoalteromonas aurantia TaxID=43654 RepID=A0ABY2VUH2_9GAMM|nr:4Fe-4S single cluster domain-containing protein [Pseudoalteromonas aurantia]TMO56522.1 hypothetical protein CWC18_19435 [Pseudoalteromonas aurantia]TMO71920.1 hypothetical protein CWC20_16330 [Pseudoalteromonas aurantia]